MAQVPDLDPGSGDSTRATVAAPGAQSGFWYQHLPLSTRCPWRRAASLPCWEHLSIWKVSGARLARVGVSGRRGGDIQTEPRSGFAKDGRSAGRELGLRAEEDGVEARSGGQGGQG